MTDSELLSLWIYRKAPITSLFKVTANDYSYIGRIVSVFTKQRGAIRCVVEDDNGRLFIHNASQISSLNIPETTNG